MVIAHYWAITINLSIMRRLLLFISIIILSINASADDKSTINALTCIRDGYVQYGVTELQKAANLNDVVAQFYVASCLEYGISIEKNLAEAFKMYRKAAERGLPDAMYHMALFYKNGIVVPQNAAREADWMNRFNSKGGALQLPSIIDIYNEGLKHPENYAMNPNGGSGNSNNNMLALNNGNINSNNTIGSNNQTINNITIVQAVPSQPVVQTPVKQEPIIRRSDVDENIPVINVTNSNTFALIIANENYQDVAKVPNAINDGTVFAEYCEKSLGLPSKNIHFIKDATLGNIKREINIIKQLADVIGEDAKIIVYYAGHGIPDESTKNAYLLPIDGSGSDLSTCYSLNEFYSILGKMPASQIVVLLDACFSGSLRGEGMLASARGVAIKAKPNTPSGKLVVFSAAQGDETAYPYKEQSHGLFTYFLLKKLKDTNGDVTLGELGDYITKEVKKVSIIENGKIQTPTVAASASISNWRNSKLR